jgi:cephalosporin hydroxylase
MDVYGSRELMRKWYDVDKYFASKKWLEDRPLDRLRPSMQNLVGKKDLVGVEVGIGHGLHSKCLYDNLDIKKLYLIDLNVPMKEATGKESPIINEPGVEFIQGNSIVKLKEIEDELDFVYLDASHDYNYVIQEMKIVYPKLKKGGILAGHDYEQIGVCQAVQTLMMNIWRETKEKPDSFFVDSCRDNHPGYPEEYLEIGFPLDWWYIKKHDLDNLEIHHLRNG